jgi:hypothetical protein
MPSIASAIPGRIRLRFSNVETGQQLEAFSLSCREQSAVTSVRINLPARSLILHFDPDTCPLATMLEWLETRLTVVGKAAAVSTPAKPGKRPRPLKLRINRVAKIGAISSLTASMIWAATGNKRLHIVSGAVFLGFLAVHMGVYRRNLVR